MSFISYKELHVTRFLSREVKARSMKSGMVILRIFFNKYVYAYIQFGNIQSIPTHKNDLEDMDISE